VLYAIAALPSPGCPCCSASLRGFASAYRVSKSLHSRFKFCIRNGDRSLMRRFKRDCRRGGNDDYARLLGLILVGLWVLRLLGLVL